MDSSISSQAEPDVNSFGPEKFINDPDMDFYMTNDIVYWLTHKNGKDFFSSPLYKKKLSHKLITEEYARLSLIFVKLWRYQFEGNEVLPQLIAALLRKYFVVVPNKRVEFSKREVEEFRKCLDKFLEEVEILCDYIFQDHYQLRKFYLMISELTGAKLMIDGRLDRRNGTKAESIVESMLEYASIGKNKDEKSDEKTEERKEEPVNDENKKMDNFAGENSQKSAEIKSN